MALWHLGPDDSVWWGSSILTSSQGAPLLQPSGLTTKNVSLGIELLVVENTALCQSGNLVSWPFWVSKAAIPSSEWNHVAKANLYVFPQTTPSPSPRSSPRLNQGRSRVAGAAQPPRFQMFLWTRVQVRNWAGARETPGNLMETEE